MTLSTSYYHPEIHGSFVEDKHEPVDAKANCTNLPLPFKQRLVHIRLFNCIEASFLFLVKRALSPINLVKLMMKFRRAMLKKVASNVIYSREHHLGIL